MIVPNFHRRPVPLDREQHLHTTLAVPWTDYSIVKTMNSVFVGGAEMHEACHDFPLVFIRAGKTEDGREEYAPIAVMGLTPGDNLYVEGTQWRSRYDPLLLRTYPFAVARVDANRYAVCLDADWPGVRPDGQGGGERVVDDAGEPTALTRSIQQPRGEFEADVWRTRRAEARLSELGLLRDMRFNGTLPNGQEIHVDGFLAVDEAKVRELPDATVVQLHREGLFPLIHAHWFSLGHVRRLLDWHAQRIGATAPAPASS